MIHVGWKTALGQPPCDWPVVGRFRTVRFLAHKWIIAAVRLPTQLRTFDNALISTLIESFIAHNSRWRLAAIFLAAVGFVALGMWTIGAFGEVPSSSRYSTTFSVVLGWMCILFFGICDVAIIKKIVR